MYKTKSKRSLNSKNNLSCTVMTTAKTKLNIIIVLSCFRFVRESVCYRKGRSIYGGFRCTRQSPKDVGSYGVIQAVDSRRPQQQI